MRPLACPAIEAAPPDISDETAGRITGFADGILLGSIGTAGSEAPTALLVTANGRTLGDAPIVWDRPAAGTWRFDIRDLPPELLLEEHISVSIKRQGRAAPLDTVDITPSQFPSLADLAAGRARRGTLEGYVDGTENGAVRGWVRNAADDAQRIKLMLFVDGRFCGTHVADLWRHDLEATGRGDGRYGFAIPAQAFFARAKDKPEVHVVATEPHLWDIPPAPHARAGKRRSAWPNRRDIPATTRELVAILAGTEPFPKKAYVIDRLSRNMPNAFSADYALLAIEYLRVEMLKAPPTEPASWRERLFAWWRQRMIRGQIRRLSALADATAASRTFLDAAARTDASPPGARASRKPFR